MQNFRNSAQDSESGLALNMPLSTVYGTGPEGALIPDHDDEEDKIAVVYDHGETPPEITISVSSECVQTVMANGVAVAIIACADGPLLSVDDILLVERFVRRG